MLLVGGSGMVNRWCWPFGHWQGGRSDHGHPLIERWRSAHCLHRRRGWRGRRGARGRCGRGTRLRTARHGCRPVRALAGAGLSRRAPALRCRIVCSSFQSCKRLSGGRWASFMKIRMECRRACTGVDGQRRPVRHLRPGVSRAARTAGGGPDTMCWPWRWRAPPWPRCVWTMVCRLPPCAPSRTGPTMMPMWISGIHPDRGQPLCRPYCAPLAENAKKKYSYNRLIVGR